MNMALLGLTLAIASLSYFIYQSPSHLWRSAWQRLPFLRQRRLPWQNGDEKDAQQRDTAQKQDKDSAREEEKEVQSGLPEITTTVEEDVDSSSKTEAHPPARRKEKSDNDAIGGHPTPSTIEFKVLRTPQKPDTPPAVAVVPPQPVLQLPPQTASQQMPPPPRPLVPNRRLLPPNSTPNSLRIPSTGPLPNRGPPSSTSTRTGTTLLAPTTSTLPPPSRPRQKVILTPGHSPLDWADLTRKHPNLAGVPHLQRVTPSQLAHNNGRKGRPAWSAFRGRVYNIGPYLPFHPGGEGELIRGAGKDAERLFVEAHPWVNWENMLGGCLVGMVVGECEGVRDDGGEVSGLEDMD